VTLQQTDTYTDHATLVGLAVDRNPCHDSMMRPKSYLAAPRPARRSIRPTYVRRQLCALSCYFVNFQSKRRLKLFSLSLWSYFDSIFKRLQITLVASSNANEVEDIDLVQVWVYPSITLVAQLQKSSSLLHFARCADWAYSASRLKMSVFCSTSLKLINSTANCVLAVVLTVGLRLSCLLI